MSDTEVQGENEGQSLDATAIQIERTLIVLHTYLAALASMTQKGCIRCEVFFRNFSCHRSQTLIANFRKINHTFAEGCHDTGET